MTKKNLDDSAQAVTEMMNNPKNYQAFMQDFSLIIKQGTAKIPAATGIFVRLSPV